MMYLKLISGQNIIGIATSDNLMKYQARHNVLLYTDIDHTEYVEYNGSLYRDNWLQPIVTDGIPFVDVRIVSIEEDEYNALKEAFETQDEIVDDVPAPEEEYNLETEELLDESVDFVKAMKIVTMSNMCNLAIVNGVDVTLSDGNSHHFSLDLTDQLNLLTLSSMVSAGETQIPYHADGELCQYYSVEDISKIITAATSLKTYHTTYFNSLKSYINSLDSVVTIGDVVYGMEIPQAYQSDILKEMLGNVG